MYKFLAYEWLMDWQAIDIDRLIDVAIRTRCHISILDIKRDERSFQFYVFGFAYQSLENLATLIKESGFRKGIWSAITQEEFLGGIQANVSEKEKVAANRFFRFHKDEFNPENNEFHQRLKTDWKYWPVFKADWRTKSIYDMTRDEKDVLRNTWQNMYQGTDAWLSLGFCNS